MEKNPLTEVYDELQSARSKFPRDFINAHEGFAILKEEIDELWDAVRLKQYATTRVGSMRKEAIQVAAMAIRFIEDVCDGKANQ